MALVLAAILVPALGIPQLQFPQDLPEIRRHLVGDKKHLPCLVRGGAASLGTPYNDGRPGAVYSALRDAYENKAIWALVSGEDTERFVWHPRVGKPSTYTSLTSWTSISGLEAFEENKSLFVVSDVPASVRDAWPMPSELARRKDMNLSLLGMVSQATSQLDLDAPDATIRISHKGAVSPLHRDDHATAFLQLEGSKEVLLYPAGDQQNKLYYYPRCHVMGRRALVDPENPSPELFPGFNASRALKVIVERQDLLYWPSNWGHHMRTLHGPSVSLTVRSSEPVDLPHEENDVASDELIRLVEQMPWSHGFGEGHQQGRCLLGDDRGGGGGGGGGGGSFGVLIIAVMAVLVGCGLAYGLASLLWTRLVRNRQSMMQVENVIPGTQPLGKIDFDLHFPVSRLENEEQCVVCLSVITTSQDCRKLQCNHVFHADCITHWWQHNPRNLELVQCPVCKQRASVSLQTSISIDVSVAPPAPSSGNASHVPSGPSASTADVPSGNAADVPSASAAIINDVP
eukprot:TRINITY_DN109152_c0_g1_i1.p1 TRINITY_DN109152_c0_g1~~TRINITY_DN109152_c0_g1_i1.p1  ORF type:complete len:514 (-),score=55.50 TRINITY_DN109152_c0_g1_i1:71-1612(-)